MATNLTKDLLYCNRVAIGAPSVQPHKRRVAVTRHSWPQHVRARLCLYDYRLQGTGSDDSFVMLCGSAWNIGDPSTKHEYLTDLPLYYIIVSRLLDLDVKSETCRLKNPLAVNKPPTHDTLITAALAGNMLIWRA